MIDEDKYQLSHFRALQEGAENGVVVLPDTVPGTWQSESSFGVQENHAFFSESIGEAATAIVEEEHPTSPSAARPTAAEYAAVRPVASYYPKKRNESQEAKTEGNSQTKSAANVPHPAGIRPAVTPRPSRPKHKHSAQVHQMKYWKDHRSIDIIWFCVRNSSL